MAITKANRSYDFEQYTADNVEGLFTLLFEIDLQIEELSVFLNATQPQVSGKLSIHFGPNQKLYNGVRLIEPYPVKLILLRGNGPKKWRMRRITKAELQIVDHRLEKLLPKRRSYKKAGYTIQPLFENHRQSVATCRLLDQLFFAREKVKKNISAINIGKNHLNKHTQAVVMKSKNALVGLKNDLTIDFNVPKIAYAIIKQKQMARI